jgi:transposase-like protein
MDCPKCGSGNVDEAYIETEYEHRYFCLDCDCIWTQWQQSENQKLRNRLKDAETVIKKYANPNNWLMDMIGISGLHAQSYKPEDRNPIDPAVAYFKKWEGK